MLGLFVVLILFPGAFWVLKVPWRGFVLKGLVGGVIVVLLLRVIFLLIVPGIGSVSLAGLTLTFSRTVIRGFTRLEGGLFYGGLAVPGYVRHASGRLSTAPLG